MLTNPDGSPVVVDAVRCIKGCDRVVITILEKHNADYDATAGLDWAFMDAGIAVDVLVLPEQTKSQADTVAQTIDALDISGPIFIKDCDNRFDFFTGVCDGDGYVCVSDLTDHEEINARNKSYCVTTTDSIITAIHEKQIVSTTFSAGGYYFEDAERFYKVTQDLLSMYADREIYVSHVINAMLGDGASFVAKHVSGLRDWGTLQDWKRYTEEFKTYFFDIDGVIMENAGRYFTPRRKFSEPIHDNVKLINELRNEGNMIILTTSRPESEREMTIDQLRAANLKYDQLVMGCLHAKRVIVNDFAKTNPYPSAEALSVPRNAILRQFIGKNN